MLSIQLLFIILVIVLSIRVAYALYFYLRLAMYRPTNDTISSKIPVSVVVCYHNESDSVKNSMSLLQAQSYRQIEIVAVDDLSSDSTLELLHVMKDNHTKIIANKEDHPGKKIALTAGINAATNDWFLMTDADCTMSNNWTSSMMNHTANSQIVLGFAPLSKGKSWISKFARYETYFTALQYFSFALAGIPYMGVGRNILYHKDIFEQEQGFSSHTDIASGDDDLLINATANSKNTSICLDPDSFVYSQAKDTFRSFIKQKTRHISSSHKYKLAHIFLLALSSFVHISGYLLVFILLTIGCKEALLGLLIYWLLLWIIQYPICKKLHSMDLWLLFPVYDIAMAIYYIIMIPFTFIKRQNTWS